MTRHFCFCIPVRVAVFVLSLLSFLASTLVAASAWLVLYDVNHGKDLKDVGDITGTKKTIDIVVGAVYTVISLFSLFGFIGAVMKNRRMVKAYSFLCWIIFALTLAVSGALLYEVFSGKTIDGTSCNIDNNDDNDDTCITQLKTWQKAVTTLVVVFDIFVQLYILIVIRRYIEQLETEDYAYDQPSGYKEYQLPKHQSYEDSQGLLGPGKTPAPYHDGLSG